MGHLFLLSFRFVVCALNLVTISGKKRASIAKEFLGQNPSVPRRKFASSAFATCNYHNVI
jgi:hypothetical protein